MQNYLVLDCETTTSNKGNPFDQTNKLCYVGLQGHGLYNIEYDLDPYKNKLDLIQNKINDVDLLIGFNIKFDLHWLKRYNITFTNKRLWDCQLVHFILTGQQFPYPSLNNVCAHYNLETKLDVVANEYWKNGIDTPDIPEEILREYLQQDIKLTELVYFKQLEDIKNNPHLARLISLHNQDLLCLQEMEYNGLLFNEDLSITLGDSFEEQIKTLDEELYKLHQLREFNPNSNDHISALLYGGDISLRRRVSCGTFKTGTRMGEQKEKWEEYKITFNRLVVPIKGSELIKEGFYSTDEKTLKSLRSSNKAKSIIELLLKRTTLEKRLSTYYRGVVNLINELNWKKGVIHGQLNQCVTRTGRLSSSKPNLQNFDGEIKSLFTSRFS